MPEYSTLYYATVATEGWLSHPRPATLEDLDVTAHSGQSLLHPLKGGCDRREGTRLLISRHGVTKRTIANYSRISDHTSELEKRPKVGMYGSFYKDFVRILARALAHVLRMLCILRLTSYKSRKLDQTPLICETEPSEI